MITPKWYQKKKYWILLSLVLLGVCGVGVAMEEPHFMCIFIASVIVSFLAFPFLTFYILCNILKNYIINKNKERKKIMLETRTSTPKTLVGIDTALYNEFLEFLAGEDPAQKIETLMQEYMEGDEKDEVVETSSNYDVVKKKLSTWAWKPESDYSKIISLYYEFCEKNSTSPNRYQLEELCINADIEQRRARSYLSFLCTTSQQTGQVFVEDYKGSPLKILPEVKDLVEEFYKKVSTGEVNKGSLLKEPVSSNKMTRSRCKFLCEKNGITVPFAFTFASRNRIADVHWADINPVFLKEDWLLVLNDQHNSVLKVLQVPANTFSLDQFYLKDDLVDIRIDPYTLVDSYSKVDFSRFLVKEIPY